MNKTSYDAEADFEQFMSRVKTRTGLDLHHYKRQQMQRRLNSLRERLGCQTFSDLGTQITRHNDTYDEFIEQLTINVTEFFRNAERWQALRAKMAGLAPTRATRLKCWSAACSTGEEPYSLAMMLTEMVDPAYLTIHATDLDPKVLQHAMAGVYPSQALRSLQKSTITRHFVPTREGQYVVSDQLKRCIHFRKHDLLSEMYDTNYDLILCRNVLIYFTEEAKDQIFRKFSRALKPGGYLFVGGTEQMVNPAAIGFELADTFIYRKIG